MISGSSCLAEVESRWKLGINANWRCKSPVYNKCFDGMIWHVHVLVNQFHLLWDTLIKVNIKVTRQKQDNVSKGKDCAGGCHRQLLSSYPT